MNREEQIVAELRLLREDNQPITLAAVKNRIMELEKSEVTQRLPESWDVTFRRTLRTLVAAGVLVRGAKGVITWPEVPAQTPPEPPNIPPNGGGGADGGPPPGGADGGHGGNNGGGGFRAVLAHPYLFALPRSEFEELLDAI